MPDIVNPAAAPVGAVSSGPEYPSTWRAEDRQHWDSASDDIRKIVSSREGSWSKERDGYKTAHENWSRYSPIIDRHKQLFEAEGIAPEMGIGSMLQLAHDLRNGDAPTKTRILDTLKEHYIGKQQPAQEYLDPELGQMRQYVDGQLQSLTKGLGDLQKLLRGYMEEGTKRDIDAFSKNPERKHFPKVSEMMGKLISRDMASGLDDAYDMAMKLHPEFGAAVKQEAQAAEAVTKSEDTKKALHASGANVRGNGLPQPATKPKASLRKSLEAQYDRIAAK